MNDNIYFISDCHFHPNPDHGEEKRRQIFFDFINSIKGKASRLYILGDLFDFWFEYKYVIPRYLIDIITELKQLSRSGCKIIYLGGNHDYWLYDFFPKNGIEIHRNSLSTEIGGDKFYLSHGEEAIDSAPFYPLVQKVLRSKLTIFLFRLLHPYLAFKIAHLISNMSKEREIAPQEYQEYTQRLIDFGQKKFAEGYDKVIIGHFHITERYSENNKVILCPGDWIEQFSYAQYNNGELKLQHYTSSGSK